MSDIVILLLTILIIYSMLCVFLERKDKNMPTWKVNELAFMMECAKSLGLGDKEVIFVTEDGCGFHVNNISYLEESDRQVVILSEAKK